MPTVLTTSRVAPEAVFPRDGFVTVDGVQTPVFLVHEGTRCDICEFEHGNKRRHPSHPDLEGVVVGCDGVLMKLVR